MKIRSKCVGGSPVQPGLRTSAQCSPARQAAYTSMATMNRVSAAMIQAVMNM